jgi:8-oxo-dGTP diphosphatase
MPGDPPDTTPGSESRPGFDPEPGSETKARFCLAVIVNGRDEILLLRRDRSDAFAPGLWGLPGGHIHEGETPAETMQRELDEEIGTGVSLRPLRRLDPVRDTLYGGVFEIHLFLFRYEGGPILRNGEHEADAWVSREAYRTYAVVDGVDEDLWHLGVWPVEWLNPGKLPNSGVA